MILYQNFKLGLVMATAMFLNLIVAALVGVGVPLLLDRSVMIRLKDRVCFLHSVLIALASLFSLVLLQSFCFDNFTL
jgi:hypothetical protein